MDQEAMKNSTCSFPIYPPEDWQIIELNKIIKFKLGRTPSRKDKRFWVDGVYPWVSISDMKNCGIINNTKELVSEQAYRDVFKGILIPKGTLLMSFKLTIGRTSILNVNAFHNEAIISIFPNEKILNKNFLFFYLPTIDFQHYQDKVIKGNTLNSNKIKRISILVPPLPEQQNIAYILSTVQEARDNTQEVIEAARAMKKSLMKHLFTYGPVSLLDVWKISLNDTDIGEVSDKWRVMQIGDVCQIKTGTTPSTENPRYYEGNIPFIKTSEIVNKKIGKALAHITEKAIEDYNLKIFPPGTVFLAMYGQGKTRGQVGILEIPAATTQNTAAITPNDELSSEFLWQWLMSQYNNLRADGSQGHISHLNLGYVKHYKIPVPPLNEQLNIIKILEAIDLKINEEENKGEALDTLFKTLRDNLMTGKIRVNHLEMV